MDLMELVQSNTKRSIIFEWLGYVFLGETWCGYRLGKECQFLGVIFSYPSKLYHIDRCLQTLF
jgi:hypothetical protein